MSGVVGAVAFPGRSNQPDATNSDTFRQAIFMETIVQIRRLRLPTKASYWVQAAFKIIVVPVLLLWLRPAASAQAPGLERRQIFAESIETAMLFNRAEVLRQHPERWALHRIIKKYTFYNAFDRIAVYVTTIFSSPYSQYHAYALYNKRQFSEELDRARFKTFGSYVEFDFDSLLWTDTAQQAFANADFEWISWKYDNLYDSSFAYYTAPGGRLPPGVDGRVDSLGRLTMLNLDSCHYEWSYNNRNQPVVMLTIPYKLTNHLNIYEAYGFTTLFYYTGSQITTVVHGEGPFRISGKADSVKQADVIGYEAIQPTPVDSSFRKMHRKHYIKMPSVGDAVRMDFVYNSKGQIVACKKQSITLSEPRETNKRYYYNAKTGLPEKIEVYKTGDRLLYRIEYDYLRNRYAD